MRNSNKISDLFIKNFAHFTGLHFQEKEIKILLLPKDDDDEKNAILEVRAGTGGDEAALFAAVLFEMYQRYSVLQGWRFEVNDVTENELGGYKEASAKITGKNVFAKLKFESGAHRVQREPVTESQGRVHTSAATVAVLPEIEEVDLYINPADLKIDVYRASGAGGQHVNRTESAVRITHIPTGIIVQCQDDRSQHKNKEKAMNHLRAKLYDQQKESIDSAYSEKRKLQVGSGDRSERIRTYNYPQGRVTDHRINLTLYKLDDVVSGDALGEIVDALSVIVHKDFAYQRGKVITENLKKIKDMNFKKHGFNERISASIENKVLKLKILS